MLRLFVVLVAVACLLDVSQAYKPSYMKMKIAEAQKRRADEEKMAKTERGNTSKPPPPPSTTAPYSSNYASGDYSYASSYAPSQNYSQTTTYSPSYSYSYYSYYSSSGGYDSSESMTCMESYDYQYNQYYSSGYQRCPLYDCRSCFCSNWMNSYTDDHSGYYQCMRDILDTNKTCGCQLYDLASALGIDEYSENACSYYGNDYSYYGSGYSYYGSGYSYYGSSGMSTPEPANCDDCKRQMNRYDFYGDENLNHNCVKQTELNECVDCFDQFDGCMDSEMEGFTVAQVVRCTQLQIDGCPIEEITSVCQQNSNVYNYYYSTGPVACSKVDELTASVKDCVTELASSPDFVDECKPDENADLIEAFGESSTDYIKQRCDKNEQAREHKQRLCSSTCSADSQEGSSEQGDKRNVYLLKELAKFIRREGFP